MLNLDWVTIGSIVSVLIAVIILVYLAIKVKGLMDKDAAAHKNQQQ